MLDKPQDKLRTRGSSSNPRKGSTQLVPNRVKKEVPPWSSSHRCDCVSLHQQHGSVYHTHVLLLQSTLLHTHFSHTKAKLVYTSCMCEWVSESISPFLLSQYTRRTCSSTNYSLACIVLDIICFCLFTLHYHCMLLMLYNTNTKVLTYDTTPAVIQHALFYSLVQLVKHM